MGRRNWVHLKGTFAPLAGLLQLAIRRKPGNKLTPQSLTPRPFRVSMAIWSDKLRRSKMGIAAFTIIAAREMQRYGK